MSLLNVTYLLGFIGLAIPLIIHLWSRKEGHVIKVGSVKFLPESETSQSSSIKLNEVLLLIMRMILLIMLCLLMAGMAVDKSKDNPGSVVLIHPEFKEDQRIQRALDTLQGIPIHYLADQYPPFSKEEVYKPISNYWSIFIHPMFSSFDTLIIFADLDLNRFKGKRPSSHQIVHWHSLQDESIKTYNLTFQNSHKSLKINAKSSFIKTNYEVQNSEDRSDTLKVAVNYNEKYDFEKKLFTSAFKVISELTFTELLIEYNSQELNSNDYDWLILLKDGEAPIFDHPTIYLDLNEYDELLTQVEWNKYRLTKRLDLNTNRSSAFISDLYMIVAPSLIDSLDQRQQELLWAMPSRANKKELRNTLEGSIPIWPWLLFVTLFIIERIFSTQRKL